MNIPASMVCPSCVAHVKPLRRKAPRHDLENVNPMPDFGWFCPVEACGVRLDNAIAALDGQPVEPEAIDPNDIPDNSLSSHEDVPEEPVKLQPRKVVPIRPVKDTEDLFTRIPREHAEAIREEAELRSRLADVVTKREKLDRLMAAISDLQAPIAAE